MGAPSRVGLFGGSFNPVHFGHLLVAQAALEELSLDRLVFIPAARSPFKDGPAEVSGPARTRLLRAALAGHPRFAVDDQEIQRGGISFTIETVRHYQKSPTPPRLFYLVGQDQLPSLHLWKEAAELAARVELVVLPRPDSTAARIPTPFRGQFLQGIVSGISSTLVRNRIQSDRPIDWLVPAAVRDILHSEQLYKNRNPNHTFS